MESLNQRQGFLVSAIVHLTLLMMLFSRPLADPSKPTPDALRPAERVAKVFVPPAETLRQILPPTALRPAAPRPVPTPPPAAAKDRISIGAPIPLQQKGPLILRKEDDLTKVAKGRPDAVPSPSAPAAAATPEPVRSADAGSRPKAPGSEGLRLPPGIGRELQRGREGSKGAAGPERPSITSSIDKNVDRLLQTAGNLGLESGTGQQMGPLFFDPMGADFTVWINHFKNEVYRNWILPQPALMGMRGHVDIEFRVERDGSLSLCRILTSSTNPALDKAAKNSLESSRFLPLPDDYGPPTVTMRASFFYNEAPTGS